MAGGPSSVRDSIAALRAGEMRLCAALAMISQSAKTAVASDMVEMPVAEHHCELRDAHASSAVADERAHARRETCVS